MNTKTVLLTASFLTLSPHCAALADVDETIVITGTKTPKLLNNSPIDVYVLEKDQIELISQGTLVDALDLIPGVVVGRNQKDGYTVFMNGFESKHVAVLLDGMPLISPTGSAVDLDQLSAVNIAQIEVVRGPGSVLYGSNAMGGVINIITDKSLSPATLTYQVGQFVNNTSSQETGADAYNHTLKVSAGREFGDWTNKAHFQFIKEAALDYQASDIKQNNADFNKAFFSVDSYGDIANLKTYLKYQFFNENKEKIDGLHPTNGVNLYQSDAQQNQMEFKIENSEHFWFVQGRHMIHEETSGYVSGLRDAEIQISQLSSQKAWQSGSVNPKHFDQSGSETVWGMDIRLDSLEQNKADGTIEVPSSSRDAIESFLQHNVIRHDVQYLFGLRVQQDSDFGFHKALRASAMWKFGSPANPVKLRLGLGEGYRVPDLKERHFRFDHSNIGYMILGNPDLVPEQSMGLTTNVSLIQKFNDWDLELDASGHYSEVEELITTQLDPVQSQATGVAVSEYYNVDEAKIYGFDLAGGVNFLNWHLKLNYSYTEAYDAEGVRLAERPRHQIKADLNYEFEQARINAALYLVYQGDYGPSASFPSGNAVDHFTTINFRLKQRLSERLSWDMAINNLLDEHISIEAQSQGLFDPRPRSTAEIRFGATYQF